MTDASTGTTTTATTSPRPRPHFVGLEGMRAVAASMVVLTHATYLAGDARSSWLATPGRFGDAGVAIFFVLSGFLIYRPFAVAHLDGNPTLPAAAFWWRRLLRIVPCYWFALTVFWAIHHFEPFGFTMGFELGPHWWKYYLLIQIYTPLAQGGIAQSWSIATEISFYLLIPFWSMLIRGLSHRKRTPMALETGGVIFLFVFGYLSRWWFSHSSALFVPKSSLLPAGVTLRAVSFTWLPNQIDTFAAGMAIAVLSAWLVRRERNDALDRWVRWPTLWWGAAFGVYIAIAYWLGDNAGDYRSTYWQLRQTMYSMLGVLMLMPLVFGNQEVGLVRRFVTWKPVWWVGTVSYGFYLWHLGIMERLVTIPAPFGGEPQWHGFHGWRLFDANVYGLIVATFVLALGAAGFSWYFVEKPLLRFKGLIGGRRALRPDDRPDETAIA